MTETWKTKKRLTKKDKTRKAEALAYSRNIYARREGDHPEVKDCLKFFLDEMKKGHWPINSRYEDKYRKAIRVFILDLFVASQITPGMYLTYSRSKEDFGKTGRYGKMYLSYGPTMNVVEYLERHGYIEHHPAQPKPPFRKLPRIKATKRLVSILKDDYKIEVGKLVWDWDEDSPTVILRDAYKKDMAYEDTPETLRMKENLRLINRNLEKHAILLYIPDAEYKDLFTRMKSHASRPAIDLTRKFLTRVFNNGNLRQGGRFYGGWWQNIPREYRHCIRLNDKDVVECDYSGLHINMLYARKGLHSPEGDVYSDIPGYPNSPDFRNFIKQLLLILVNSDDREKAREAIQDTVYRKRRIILPEEIIPSTEGKHIFPLIDAFSEKHEAISDLFCTGAGIDLQYLDSQIAEQVMVHFSKMGYAILPMHDSFIIHHGLEQELKDSMNQAFRDMFDVDISVDLKYNSITERDNQEPSVCEDELEELLETQNKFSIYHTLLGQFRKYKQRYEQGEGDLGSPIPDIYQD